MKKRGRPTVPLSIGLTIWLLVELLRDRQEANRERLTERNGCRRLEKHLSECFSGERILGFETIRRHYNAFKKLMRFSPLDAVQARIQLDRARQRRELCGWNVSTWAFVLDPDDPSIAERLSTAAN